PELLETIRKAVPAAYAVRSLRSGDVDVHVPTQALKDQLLNGPDAPGCKILRKDYLIEVPGVPLTTKVASGKNADNSDTIRQICEATKCLVPGMAISRLHWLHDGDTPARRTPPARATEKPPKTRGTLIIGLPTQA